MAQAVTGNNCAFGMVRFGSLNTMAITVSSIVVAGNGVEAELDTICRIESTTCNQPVGGACPGNTASPNYVKRQIIAMPER